MEIAVTQEQGRVPVTVIRPEGRIHLGNARELEAAAKEAYEGGARHMVVDLAEVESLTSAGLRSLLNIHRLLASETEPEGGLQAAGLSPYLKLANPSEHVREVLQIAGFESYLQVHGGLAEAVASF